MAKPTRYKLQSQKKYPKLKVYTKTGDKGETSLFGGKRVPKYNLRVEAYGTVDELNSAIGVVIAELTKKHDVIKKELIHIQHDLFEVGTLLANPIPNQESKIERQAMLLERSTSFEKLIDNMADKIPDFQCFILPGGSKGGAYLHLARTIARRAERCVVRLSREEKVESSVFIYLNRLSDLLFTLARFINYKENKKEIIWH